MVDLRLALLNAGSYIRDNPEEVWRALRNLPHFRFGLPLAALRYVLRDVEDERQGPKDVVLAACPPGIRVSATVNQMETLIRGSAVLTVGRVDIGDGELRVEVRLSEVSVVVLDDQARTPLAALIRSGALDLSRAANLVAHMPTRPAVLVEAVDDTLILDFMRIPRLAQDERLRRVIGLVAKLLSVKAVETDDAHLDLVLRAFPRGIAALFSPPSP
jgi:hypothetical protein